MDAAAATTAAAANAAAATTTVATHLRRSTPTHAAYTVRVANRRVLSLVTAHPAYARRWVHTTRWQHRRLLRSGRLIVGLGVQWTPVRCPLHGAPPPPATLQLCAGHRCLVFQIAHAVSLPEALRRFLADPRVTFVGSGSLSDRRMLSAYYGLHVASARELRAMAGMGNASMASMADRFLGYPGIDKPKNVAMSAWHVPYLSLEQVEYACVDAYLAFRLGVHLCSDHVARPAQRAPVLLHAPPPAQRAPVRAHVAPPAARAPPVYAVRPAELAAPPHWALLAIASGDDAAESEYSSKIADDARPRVTASDSDMEDDGDEGLSMVNSSSYASYDHDFYSDEFEFVRQGFLSSDDDYVLGMGAVLNSDDGGDDEAYEDYTNIGIMTLQNYEMGAIEEMSVSNRVATLEELEEDTVTGSAMVTVEEGGGGGEYQALEGGYGEDDWYVEDQGRYVDEYYLDQGRYVDEYDQNQGRYVDGSDLDQGYVDEYLY
ncbi:hypothetical protein ABZP36_001421 [Zizania latifolia]